MKTTILTAAMIGAILLPSLAFADPRIVDGCEIVTVEGTNYSNKIDPSCDFASFPAADKDDRAAAAAMKLEEEAAAAAKKAEEDAAAAEEAAAS